MIPALERDPDSLCVVLLTGIGDVVHGLPVVNALRARWPDVRVTWVAEPAPADVLRHHPAVDRVVVFRKAEGLGGIRRLFRELWPLGPFDATINAQRYFKSVWPTMFSRAPVRAGLPRDKTRDGVSLWNTHHLPDGPWAHTQDLFLGFLDLFGVERPAEPEWGLTLAPDEETAAAAFFGEVAVPSRPRVGLVTGTANPAKDWPAERYPPLAEALARAGWQVFLLGGPGRRERAVARRTIAETRGDSPPPVWGMAGSVRELIWRIRGMDLLVSPDTGPIHLARAMGVPVIGLYGHTNPWRVGPWRAYAELVIDAYTESGEAPGPTGYDPKPSRMETIQVNDVLAKVELARRAYGTGAATSLAPTDP